MTPTNASPSSPAGDDRNLVPVDENYIAPSFEDRLALFWAKNSKSVLMVCVLADAQSGYEKAAGVLGGTTFGQRARLGAAVSLLRAGKSTEGEAALKQLVGDLALIKGIRAEAAYMLAALATEAGRTADSTKWAGQVSAIDPSGQWAQRAAMLHVSQLK